MCGKCLVSILDTTSLESLKNWRKLRKGLPIYKKDDLFLLMQVRVSPKLVEIVNSIDAPRKPLYGPFAVLSEVSLFQSPLTVAFNS